MIIPFRKGEALAVEMQQTVLGPNEFCLWWLGQSGFLLKGADRYAVIDPYLSDSLTRKYAGTNKPHVRMTEQCMDPSDLGFVSTVLSTHGHTDHFDPETLRAIAHAPGRRQPLAIILPAAIAARGAEALGDLDVRLVPIEAGQTVTAGDVGIRAMPAAHPCLERDGSGRHLYLGYMLTVGGWRIYHSGDTVWHEEVVAQATLASPHIALLPINGNLPERGAAGNFDGIEAARFARTLGVSMAIPHHFEMFAFNTASPGGFVAECNRLGVPHTVLRCGECWRPVGGENPIRARTC
jgi:L-ascorbate metabolism protein UlaG (beta-lactamase superfamily)